MHLSFEYITSLQYEVKKLTKLIEAFRSGEKYTRMQKEFHKIIDGLKREIRSLKAELAAAHAETIRVRNQWYEIFEDMEKERGKNQELTARVNRDYTKTTHKKRRIQRHLSSLRLWISIIFRL